MQLQCSKDQIKGIYVVKIGLKGGILYRKFVLNKRALRWVLYYGMHTIYCRVHPVVLYSIVDTICTVQQMCLECHVLHCSLCKMSEQYMPLACVPYMLWYHGLYCSVRTGYSTAYTYISCIQCYTYFTVLRTVCAIYRRECQQMNAYLSYYNWDVGTVCHSAREWYAHNLL